MKKWLKKSKIKKRLIITTVSMFTVSTILYSLPQNLQSNISPTNAYAAVTSTADKHGLGLEEYWNFYSKDLGAGWRYNVNTATGNVVIGKTLFNIQGRGIPLKESLVYNSSTQQDNGAGIGWTLSSGMFMAENPDGSVTYKDEDGTNHTFTKNPDGTYNPPAGVFLTLTKLSSSSYTIKGTDQTISRFDNGKISSMTDIKGNKTSYTYDSNGRLLTLTDSTQRSLTYSYDTNGRLISISDPASHKMQFSYDTSGKLTTITDPKNNKTQFEYDASYHLKSFIDGNTHKTTFAYDSQSRISQINDARTNTSTTYSTTFTYDNTNLKTTITDPTGKTSTFVHNQNGNVLQYVSQNGETYNYQWNQNQLVSTSDSSGSSSFQYDSQGNNTQVSTTINSNTTATTQTQYNSANQPTEITDPNANKTDYAYDSSSNQIAMTNPERLESNVSSYDNNGNLTSSTDLGAPTFNLLENGSFERQDSTTGDFIGWHKDGDLTSISADESVHSFGKQSVEFTSTNSTSSYLWSDSIPVSAGDKITLSASGRMSSVISSSGGASMVLVYYDQGGNKISTTPTETYKGSGNVNYITSDTVPANCVNVVVGLNFVNSTGAAWFDGIQLEKAPNGSEGNIISGFNYIENSGFEYGGDLWNSGSTTGSVSITNEAKWSGSQSAKVSLSTNGDVWVNSTDIPLNNDGPLTLSGYIKTDNLSGTGARIEINYYDSSNNLITYATTKLITGTQDFTRYAVKTTPPTNAVKAVVSGNVWGSTGTAYFDDIKLVPSVTSLYSYDSKGNYQTSIQNAKGRTTRFTYDSIGNTSSVTDPNENKTSYSYDGNNNLSSVTDASLHTTYYNYDANNSLVSIQDARSTSSTDSTYRTTFGYNELNQLTSVVDPLGQSSTFTYDKSGNLESSISPDGKKVAYSYDSNNRLSQVSYVGTNKHWDYHYDSTGNLTTVTDEQNRVYNFGYDGANRVTSFSDLLGYSLNYQLDNVGNVLSMTDSIGNKTTFNYGSDNRLLSMTEPSGRQTKYQYDDAGRPFQVSYGNGVISTIKYDSLGQITSINDSGLRKDKVINYRYDANGNILSINGLYDGAEEQFTYDNLNRLTSWENDNGKTYYAYDSAGNLTTKGQQTFSYNAVNQITNAGFTYDQNGNMTCDGKNNYSYDQENHLVKVTKVSDGSIVATYEYDYRGLRISKTTSSGTTYFDWDGKGQLVRESDPTGKTLNLYSYNPNGQLVSFQQNGMTYYVHTNHRGDILGITDGNRNQVATYQYGPWGEFLGKTGSVDIPIRYAGYYFDSETGFYYLKSRYYSPDLGRFITKDKFQNIDLNQTQSLNLYAYANNNPVNNVDPLGYFTMSIISVKWAGAIFNTLIGIVIGGIAGGIAGYIRHVGEKEAEKVFTRTLTSQLKSWGLIKLAGSISIIVTTVLNALDFGGAIARALDRIDPKPNNGWLDVTW